MSINKELPAKYYLEYFEYLLSFVAQKYVHILIDTELDFIQNFDELTEDEKCLFVRFSNRKGVFFTSNNIKYSEICQPELVLKSLILKGFLEEISQNHIHDLNEILDLLNKKDLIDLLKSNKIDTKGKVSLSKDDLLKWVLSSYTSAQILVFLQEVHHLGIIKVAYNKEVQMLKFLFFGTIHGNMTEFVVRDLGFNTFEKYDEDKMVAHFENREEAEQKFAISLLREDFTEMQKSKTPALEVYNWFVDWAMPASKNLCEIAQTTYDHFLIRVAAYLEKNKLEQESLQLYRLTELAPARERRVRVLFKLKCFDEAHALCELILEKPANADESFFANDYLNKIAEKDQKKKTKKAVTQQLQNAETILLDSSWKYKVELGVMDYFEQKGQKAAFTENHLWRSFFGLFFWDIIYDTDILAIHHPLQRTPSDLYKADFFIQRQEKFQSQLEKLSDKEWVQEHIYSVFFEKYGITNPLVDWFGGLFPLIIAVLEKIDGDKLKLIFQEMTLNLRANTKGFPDLMVWDDGEYAFVEVKSPTDTLSSQQLYWLHFFDKIGVNAKVIRVEWVKTKLFD
ncbi:MAG: VRR-NUC domain-containing protein [Pseudarcicella sp.]|nr:VRR-NUC domain-containing protein [Pseudarcicella sp.]